MGIIIENGLVVTPEGIAAQDLLIEDGRIVARTAPGALAGNQVDRRIDATGLHVFPGVIDPHAHFGLGGDEDWAEESKSAVLGGVTTVLNYVMTSGAYEDEVARELELAGSGSMVDYGFHLCPCMPDHLERFDSYVDDLGVTSFKYFMHFRGEEGAYLDISGSDDSFMFNYLQRAAARPGVTANIHAENIEVVWRLRQQIEQKPDDGLVEFESSRPDFVEAEAAFRASMYGSEVGARVYVVHMSSKLGLEAMQAVRRIYPDAALFVETCPHYLTHTADTEIGTIAKVNPPLRSAADQEALWAGIAAGAVETVGSDHCARPRTAKEGSVWKASAGMPGAQAILTVMLSEGHHRRGLPLETIVRVTAENPARIFGLEGKGRLEPGYDADVVLVDLDAERVVDAETWGSRPGRYNIWEGWRMRGWPVLTMSRGEVIMERGELLGAGGRGKYLSRSAGRA
jgi:dihydropyrimidinase